MGFRPDGLTLLFVLCPLCGQRPSGDLDAKRITALIERLKDADKGVVAVAQEQLARIGKPAVAELMKVVKTSGAVSGSKHSLDSGWVPW